MFTNIKGKAHVNIVDNIAPISHQLIQVVTNVRFFSCYIPLVAFAFVFL